MQKEEPISANPEWEIWFSFPVGKSGMNRINCFGFYTLGKYINKVQSLGNDAKDLDLLLAAARADNLLKVLLTNQNLNLKSTFAASSSLLAGFKHLSEFFEKSDEDAPKPEQKNLQRNLLMSGIKLSIDKMETVLSTELALAPIYSVPPRGVFSTDSLLDSADDVFGDVKYKIPDDAIADTKQAGRCLAFDLPNAAGFHVARATEAVMKKAMEIFDCPPLKESQRNWGNFIRSLEEHGLNQSLVHHLNQLRELHRNPLIHPEVTLRQTEAQQLWSMCTSAMIALVEEMNAKELINAATEQLGEDPE